MRTGLCSLSRNCDWCTGVFGGRIKNLQAKSEIAAVRSGGIQQVSLQGCDGGFLFCFVVVLCFVFYFLASCSERPFWVGCPCFTKKFRDLYLLCVAG